MSAEIKMLPSSSTVGHPTSHAGVGDALGAITAPKAKC